MFSQLFYERNVKWPTIIFSEANYSTCFSNMPILRVTEEEKKCACFNYLHLFVPTNNKTEFSSTSKTRQLLLLKNNKTLFY